MATRQYIVFDGIIGAGKSTLIKRIKDYLSQNSDMQIFLIDEPVELWQEKGVLQKSYSDPLTWNFPAQCFFFHSRIEHTRKIMNDNSGPYTFLSERSPFTDQIFWNVQKQQNRLGKDAQEGELLHETYLGMWKLWIELLPMLPTKFVYLRPTLDECMNRMNSRARECEKDGVSQSYQEALLREHDALFRDTSFVQLENGQPIPVVNIDSNADFKNCDIELEKIINQIFK